METWSKISRGIATQNLWQKADIDIDKCIRSPFFEDLEEVGMAFQLKMRKTEVRIGWPYQCRIAVYQMAKLRMLEFYYDFIDKYIDRKDFELIQMDTDSLYMAPSVNLLKN